MYNNPTRTIEDDDDMMQMMPTMVQPFMTVVKNDRHNRIELHLRGEFGSPQQSTKELTELSHLSEVYPTCLVYINSNGGRVDLLREIVTYLEKFDHVITVVTSNAASAGLMLWGIGDIRVVCPHAELMAHRETSGYLDKTDAIVERGDFLKRRFELMFNDMCGAFLTDEEISRARFTEVWLLGQDLIDRGAAISWEQFHFNDTMPVMPISVIERNNVTYVEAGGDLYKAELTVDESRAYSLMDVMYGIDPPESVATESGSDVEASDATLWIDEDKEVTALVTSEDQVRELMIGMFGAGNYKINASGGVFAKINGSFVKVWQLGFDVEDKMLEFNEDEFYIQVSDIIDPVEGE